MYEKVNPQHPDKVADRIAGAIVDLAYAGCEGGFTSGNPRIAVEVLLGHGKCYVIIETSLSRQELKMADVGAVVHRLAGDDIQEHITIVGQDVHLSDNQKGIVRCGDNGIFCGKPVTKEQKVLAFLAKEIYQKHPTDGKYILNDDNVIICQSNMSKEQEGDLCILLTEKYGIPQKTINPLGFWTGGADVDSGATNRKLGSDMGDAVTGGGLHGKDLSKADVSVNIVCHLKAQQTGAEVRACTAIGDSEVTFVQAGTLDTTMSYVDVVEMARLYILTKYGSFEKFAEWGLLS